MWSRGLIACSLLLSLHALGADKTWTNGAQNGLWGDDGNWAPAGIPANGDVAIFNAVGGAVTVNDNRTIQQLRVNGTVDVVITIANGMMLSVANSGSQGIQAYTADLAINGPGKLALSVAGTGANDVNHLDNGANPGRTLAIGAQIVALDGGNTTGFETWVANNAKGGTVAFNNPNNAFTLRFNAGNGYVVVAPTLSNLGSPSSIGDMLAFMPSRGSILRYTGPAVSTDRLFQLNGGDSTLGYGGGIEQAGSGVLTWAGAISNINNSAQTLQLLGESTFEGRVTGQIANGMGGTLGIAKHGSGTWVLAGNNNTFSGGIAVNVGTLAIADPGAAGTGQITVTSGARLAINPAGADHFTMTVPTVTGGIVMLSVSEAPTASSVTFNSLTATSAIITAPNAGTAANRIFITGLQPGAVGPWLTLNGGLATYDLVNGLTPQAPNVATLATRGSTLPSGGSTVRANINAAAHTGLPIALPADLTSLYSLTQVVADDAAVVNTAGKTLMLSEVAIGTGASPLTIGVNAQEGALLPPLQLGTVPAPNIPDNSAVAALNPLIWWDPSDASTVTLYGNVVTGIENKGSSGATHDAVVRPTWNAPFYATGNESHSALPMLKMAANSQGLQSAAATGISGKGARTIVAVMSRNAGLTCIVSMGTGADRQAFEPYLMNDRFRFGTYAGDIDILTVPAAETPIVMTFLNGVEVDQAPDYETFQGFADSVPSGTRKEASLNTANTPLHIMSRNGGTAGEYRGQVGEVLLFNYTLSSGERLLVENYLKSKWQQPKTVLPAQSAALTLRNDSTLSPLTVNAAIEGPDGGTISLLKSGEGDVILAGGAKLQGPTVIGAGALTVNTPAGFSDILTGISGAGKLVKTGDGTLRLPYTAANLYTGGTDISGGIVQVGNSRSLGSGPVTIDGGTLDLGGGLGVETITISNPIRVSGAGMDGQGVIVHNGTVSQRNAFQNSTITLDADATFGGSSIQRFDLAGMDMTLDLNGHTLTKKGTADFRISPATVIGAPAGTAFNIEGGVLGLESQTLLSPNTGAQEIQVHAGGRFGLYNTSIPVNWTVKPTDGGEIWAYGNSEATNINVLASDILLNDGVALHLTASGTFSKTLAGQLTGLGGLSVHDGGMRAMSLLANPANTFQGTIAVSNAAIGLLYPGSLPSVGQVSIAPNSGAVRVFMGGNGWPVAQVKALAESGKFNSAAKDNQRLQIDVGAGMSVSLPAFNSTFNAGLDKFGAGSISFDEDTALLRGNIRTYAGGLIFTNDVTFNAMENHLYLGEGTSTDGTGGLCLGNVIGGEAIYTSADNGYYMPGPAIYLAAHNSKTVLDVKDSAQVKANMILGGWDSGDTSAVGAIYQSGDSEWLCTGGAANDARIGRYGHGYYQLDNGVLTLKGWTNLGTMNNASSVGMIRQTGGTLVFTGGLIANPLPSNGTFGDFYGGCIDLSRGGVGILHLEGGVFRHYGELRILNESDNGSNNGLAVVTVTGSAEAMTDRQIYMGHRNNGTAILNLNNGGTLTTTYILRKDRASSTVSVNFNGGTLCVTNNAGNQYLFARESSRPMFVNMYEAGGTIDLGDGVSRIVDFPIDHPTGAGVAGIAINAAGTGYIAPPHVNITGGGGSGATAIANINRETGALTGIEITSPGKGYTSTPTVTLVGGGGSGATLAAARTASNIAGGLTKAGAGILILSAANTYQGPTRVNGGTLLLKHPQAIHPRSEIIIGDGVLDLGGHTITNISVTINGSGGIANGKIVTASAIKTGAGTGRLDASIEFATIDAGRVPGLWEGRYKGTGTDYWNLTIPNPRDSVQLTTRAGNMPSPTINNGTGIAAPFWSGNYNMWIYTGYVWNNSPTNETWSWRGVFDDYVNLQINGVQVFTVNGNTVTIRNHELKPGANEIEIRFGDGTGNVGAYSGASGLLYDPLGRASADVNDYRVLADDGTGTLLSVMPGTVEPQHSALRVEEGTLLVPPPEPGLWEGNLPGNNNTADANPRTAVELTTAAANGKGQAIAGQGDNSMVGGKYWPTNSTYIYTGYIWNRTDSDVTLTFAENFDDNCRFSIDGTYVLNDGTWNNPTRADAVLSPGPHTFEARFGQGGGGVAANNAGWWTTEDMAFGVDFQGRNEGVLGNFEIPFDDGKGTLFTLTSFGAGAGVLDGVTIDIAGGATLDLGGIPRDGLTVIGSGTVTNGTIRSGIISPAGDDDTGDLAIGSIPTLAGMTYNVTVHDYPPEYYVNAPGLWEDGPFDGALNLDTPNARTRIEPTTTAANGHVGAVNQPINGKFWGEANTWVYSGYIWNHAATNATWTFAKSFDDSVWMSIDDKVYINHTVYNQIVTVNVTLTPGPHAFEIRFGQGTGGIGAMVQSWWESNTMPVGVDFQGRDEPVFANYAPLANTVGNIFLTTTAHVDNGYPCDIIISSGTLDLTGLTIKPSDDASVSPPGNNYVIARASGGFTGTPTVEDFTGKKWKTLRKGNELLLTTQGGTIMILK